MMLLFVHAPPPNPGLSPHRNTFEITFFYNMHFPLSYFKIIRSVFLNYANFTAKTLGRNNCFLHFFSMWLILI